MPKLRFDRSTTTPAMSPFAAIAASTRLPPTQPQLDYLEILLNDAGYGTRARRKDWIGNRVHREVKFLDELSRMEASKLIEELKEDVGSKLKSLADRQLCMECGGIGMVCHWCGKGVRECKRVGKHDYSPILCVACDGKRFED